MLKFEDLKTLKKLLNLLNIDKGDIESLSANDCILIENSLKVTTLTVVDPGRGSLSLKYFHNINGEGGSEFNEYSLLIHFPDLQEKLNRFINAKAEFVELYLKNHLHIKYLKSKSILRIYTGANSDFRKVEPVSFKVGELPYNNNYANLINSLIIYTEPDKAKRTNSLNSAEIVVLRFKENSLQILGHNKALPLTYCQINIPIENYTQGFCLDIEFEVRYLKQLAYLYRADLEIYVDKYKSLITFKSVLGELTLTININSRGSFTFDLFREDISFKNNFGNVNIENLYQNIINLQSLINNLKFLTPSKTELFLNRVVCLVENKTLFKMVPANNVSGEEQASIEIQDINRGEFHNFIVLINTLSLCLKVLNYRATYYNSNFIFLTLKEIKTQSLTNNTLQTSNLNLYLNPSYIQEEEFVLDNNLSFWVSVERLQSSLDTLEVNE